MPSKEKPPPKDDGTQSKTKPPSIEPVSNEKNHSANNRLLGLYVLAAAIAVTVIGGIFIP